MEDPLERIAARQDWQYQEWAEDFGDDTTTKAADTLALRRDMVTLLHFVEEHKVVGTRSTGNMPLKMIRQVTAEFVNPPELEEKIGDQVYQLRTEYNLWPLYFLHSIAEVGGLLTTPQGARWRLTPAGEAFLGADSPHQVLKLLTIWWFETNWMIAYPLTGLGDYLPRGFTRITLSRLVAIPPGRRIPFPAFADTLAGRTGLEWEEEWAGDHTDLLRWAIRRIVIIVAADFGIIEPDYAERPPGLAPKLLAFRVTPFGRTLLTALTLLTGQP